MATSAADDIDPTVTTGAAAADQVVTAPAGRSLEECMSDFLDGHAGAFDEIYRRVAPRLRRSLRVVTRSEHLADDLTQTTFLKVLAARRSYQRGMSVEAWIWIIARNARLDDGRRRARRAEVLVADVDASVGQPAACEAPPALAASHVERALGALPEAQREAVVLLKVHELSAQDAALAAGTSVGAIKMRAQRAYEALRRALAEEVDT